MVAPGASGTNDLDHFKYVDCIIEEAEYCVEYLRKIWHWLEVSDWNRSIR